MGGRGGLERRRRDGEPIPPGDVSGGMVAVGEVSGWRGGVETAAAVWSAASELSSSSDGRLLLGADWWWTSRFDGEPGG